VVVSTWTPAQPAGSGSATQLILREVHDACVTVSSQRWESWGTRRWSKHPNCTDVPWAGGRMDPLAGQPVPWSITVYCVFIWWIFSWVALIFSQYWLLMTITTSHKVLIRQVRESQVHMETSEHTLRWMCQEKLSAGQERAEVMTEGVLSALVTYCPQHWLSPYLWTHLAKHSSEVQRGCGCYTSLLEGWLHIHPQQLIKTSIPIRFIGTICGE
jgi:hypothetical protein